MAGAQAEDVRSRIAADLARDYDGTIGSFFQEALGAERETWATCSKCNHRTRVDVPDWSARTRALQLMIEQGYGRPKAESAEGSSTTLIVQRVWPIALDELAGAIAHKAAPPQDWQPGEGEDGLPPIAPETIERAEALLIEAGWTPPSLVALEPA